MFQRRSRASFHNKRLTSTWIDGQADIVTDSLPTGPLREKQHGPLSCERGDCDVCQAEVASPFLKILRGLQVSGEGKLQRKHALAYDSD